MSPTKSTNSLPMILGGILILVLMAFAAIQSGHVADFMDLRGIIFVVAGGIALVMISFSGKEGRRAILHAIGASGDEAEIKTSINFWEAAGRSFWMLGGLRSILGLILGFEAMKTQESAGVAGVINAVIGSLLCSFYGILLAVLCLVPCWKLIGRLQSRTYTEPRDEASSAFRRRPGMRLGVVAGYFLFFAALILTIPNLSMAVLWNVLPSIVYWPSFLVVLGGAVALMFFMGSPQLVPASMSFAFMGLIGFLIAFIQMLMGMGSSQIVSVASNLVFLLSSCTAALLGMALVGAPLEDHAIRTGQAHKPSPFSRASWYGFPLLTLALMPMVIIVITTPMPRKGPRVTEMTAAVEEQRSRYEARAPQSEPIDLSDSNLEKSHLIQKVNPVYPEQAKREGIQGKVDLRIIVNEDGFVYEAQGNPNNNPILQDAAIRAVKRWRFSPFLVNGVPVALKTSASVNFALK